MVRIGAREAQRYSPRILVPQRHRREHPADLRGTQAIAERCAELQSQLNHLLAKPRPYLAGKRHAHPYAQHRISIHCGGGDLRVGCDCDAHMVARNRNYA